MRVASPRKPLRSRRRAVWAYRIAVDSRSGHGVAGRGGAAARLGQRQRDQQLLGSACAFRRRRSKAGSAASSPSGSSSDLPSPSCWSLSSATARSSTTVAPREAGRPHLLEGDPGRGLHPVRVQQVEAIPCPRPGAALDARTRPQRRRLYTRLAPSAATRSECSSTSLRARTESQPQGIATTTSAPAAAASSHSAVRDFLPASPSASSPPASSIISGTQCPPMKTGSSHSRASTLGRAAPATASRTAASRASWRSAAPRRPRPPRPPRPRRVTSRSRPARRSGSSEITSGRSAAGRRPRGRRRRRRRRRRRPPACRIRSTLELGQRRLVELVQVPARAVSARTAASISPAARPSGMTLRVQVGARRRLGREVALVGDRDDLVAEPERE